MSGIVGIVHRDGCPADFELITRMTASLDFRGPDGRDVWVNGSVSFGHSLLKTTFESAHETQPHQLDGTIWITADARIDAREDLIASIGLPPASLALPDCDLILRAYARWGEDCVRHFLGDFAFAIWDSRERKLFCARDQFGIRPFYYSDSDNTFVFSNTLDCVRLHPSVSDELNENAIADFLAFDFNQDPESTAFSAVHRLPPAHVLTLTAAGLSVRSYWSLPESGRIRYRHTRDYVEHFQTLLQAAVGDRLRLDRAAVLMSGGLDSPAVAAFARKASPSLDLRAYTILYESLMFDDERKYSTLVAQALGCPITHTSMDADQLFESVLDDTTPQPYNDPFWPFYASHTRRIASVSPVVLTGLGADPLMWMSPLLSWEAVRSIPPVQSALNFFRYAVACRTVPKFRLRSTVKHLLGRAPDDRYELPEWINSELISRCSLAERALTYSRPAPVTGSRPYARYALQLSSWPYIFESQDASWARAPLEYRHPFFDLRLVQYFLSIPELPWSMDKWILRLAIKGLVPEAVRLRPKTTLRRDTLQAAVSGRSESVPPVLPPQAGVERFIDRGALPAMLVDDSVQQVWTTSRAISLNVWLYHKRGEYYAERNPKA